MQSSKNSLECNATPWYIKKYMFLWKKRKEKNGEEIGTRQGWEWAYLNVQRGDKVHIIQCHLIFCQVG